MPKASNPIFHVVHDDSLVLYMNGSTNDSNTPVKSVFCQIYEGWNFNSGNYLFTTDTK